MSYERNAIERAMQILKNKFGAENEQNSSNWRRSISSSGSNV
jgi:hypothetical protein